MLHSTRDVDGAGREGYSAAGEDRISAAIDSLLSNPLVLAEVVLDDEKMEGAVAALKAGDDVTFAALYREALDAHIEKLIADHMADSGDSYLGAAEAVAWRYAP